ncbi:MAG TPA: methyltransferase domain-containing protein [Pyrinomonadaceae bacterium]|nr:methyltransferase domain-containing protein [Pyrinomonadaceae bacterium]
MKQRLLQFLACPSCQGNIHQLSASKVEGRETLEGELECESCKRRYPIIRGIPRFADIGEVESDKAATAEKFGWSWQHFDHSDSLYADQFLGWLAPVRPEFFREKVVLEGGCGKGRHTQLVAGWGARDIVSVDLSEAVERAFAATRGLENAHIVQADMYRLPVRRVFDYAFSVGVLHHLPDPKAGFISLAAKVKSGGHISAWVYGAENNGWIVNLVNPVRKSITSRIDPRALLQLSKIPAALFFAATKGIYGPLNRSEKGKEVASHLFYNDYLSSISVFNWREHHAIVFDHLIAPTAFYLSRDEFAEWWQAINASEVTIGWHNKNSWRGFGKISN